MDDADGIDAAVAPEHLAEKQPSNQGERRQDGTGHVSGGKQCCRDPNRRRTPEQFFATREEKRLQHEFLDQRPRQVLPGRMKVRPRRIRRYLAARPTHCEHQEKRRRQTNREHQAGAKAGRQAQTHPAQRGPVHHCKHKNRDDRDNTPRVAEYQPRRPQRALDEHVGNNHLEPGEITPVGERDLQRSQPEIRRRNRGNRVSNNFRRNGHSANLYSR